MGNRVFMDILYLKYKIISEIVIKNIFCLTLGDKNIDRQRNLGAVLLFIGSVAKLFIPDRILGQTIYCILILKESQCD